MGIGGCWYVVNTEITQADLDELAGQFGDNGCQGPVCACLPPPENIACVNGTCAEI
jgi:hypothetical protein